MLQICNQWKQYVRYWLSVQSTRALPQESLYTFRRGFNFGRRSPCVTHARTGGLIFLGPPLRSERGVSSISELNFLTTTPDGIREVEQYFEIGLADCIWQKLICKAICKDWEMLIYLFILFYTNPVNGGSRIRIIYSIDLYVTEIGKVIPTLKYTIATN